MSNQRVVCFYHANCLDGVAAAYAVKLAYPNIQVEFIPSNYGMKIPEGLKGRKIFIVDFSFKQDQMLQLMEDNYVVVLDHHESAAKELDGLVEVDQTQSGAVQAWKFFHGPDVPLEYQYIQDRDLWNFNLPETRAWTEGAFTYPMTLEGFEELYNESKKDMGPIIKIGTILLRKRKTDLDNILKTVRRMTINGYDVPVVNANYVFASDLGNIMSKDEPFAVIYSDNRDCRQFSLRSQKVGGVDVAIIAEAFGGGGHKNASGFKIPFDHPNFAKSLTHLEGAKG